MRVGQLIRAELIYPVYSADTLILREKTIVTGMVTELRRDRPRRIRAAVNGDLTPFRIPIVRFSDIILSDGTSLVFSSDPVTDGARPSIVPSLLLGLKEGSFGGSSGTLSP
jgi:hypothetical protein